MQMIDTPVPIRAMLGNENLRGELNGKKRRPMVDLKLSANFDGSILNRLEPDLLDLLFRLPHPSENADLADRDRKSVVRMPLLEPLRWKKTHEGYTIKIAHGARGDASALIFDKVKLANFVITPQQGGTVLLEWSAAVDPEGKLDELATHMHSEIDLTMTPPTPDQQRELDLAANPTQPAEPTSGKPLDGLH